MLVHVHYVIKEQLSDVRVRVAVIMKMSVFSPEEKKMPLI